MTSNEYKSLYEIDRIQSSKVHNNKSCTLCGIFYLAACSACFAKNTNEKSRVSEANQGFLLQLPRRTNWITQVNPVQSTDIF